MCENIILIQHYYAVVCYTVTRLYASFYLFSSTLPHIYSMHFNRKTLGRYVSPNSAHFSCSWLMLCPTTQCITTVSVATILLVCLRDRQRMQEASSQLYIDYDYCLKTCINASSLFQELHYQTAVLILEASKWQML